jgi:ribosomal-protein-alanine N-acetyltransferase
VPAIATLEAASAPLSAGWTAAQVEEELPREIAVVLVADKAQEDEAPSGNGDTAPLAGWAAAWRVAGELQVLAIAVDPARRRSGVGRALLDGLLALVDEDEDQDGGASSASPPPPLATLELRADNAAAAALYASCGFVEVGRRKGYYDGGRVDAVLLEKPRKG